MNMVLHFVEIKKNYEYQVKSARQIMLWEFLIPFDWQLALTSVVGENLKIVCTTPTDTNSRHLFKFSDKMTSG